LPSDYDFLVFFFFEAFFFSSLAIRLRRNFLNFWSSAAFIAASSSADGFLLEHEDEVEEEDDESESESESELEEDDSESMLPGNDENIEIINILL
jgi:hypothetical protein